MPLYEMLVIVRAQNREKTKMVILNLCKTLYKLESHLTDIKMLSGTALPYNMKAPTKELLTHGLFFALKFYATTGFRGAFAVETQYNPDIVRKTMLRCGENGKTNLEYEFSQNM